MTVLIDNVEAVLDNNSFQRIDLVNGRAAPVADHSSSFYRVPYEGVPNFKFITCGHVYIANYNKDTYAPKNALTFVQYRQLLKEGKPYL